MKTLSSSELNGRATAIEAADITRSPYQTNVKTVANYRGVSMRAIQRACEKGDIPAKKVHDEWKILTSWFEEEKHRDLAGASYGSHQP